MSAPELLPILPSLFERMLLNATPIINAARATAGVRLTASCTADSGYALSELGEALAAPLAELAPLPVLLSAPGAQLDRGVTKLQLPPNVALELDAKLVAHRDAELLVQHLAGRGLRLALHGRAPRGVPEGLLGLFDCAVILHDEDRRFRSNLELLQRRRLPFYLEQVHSVAEASAAYERGAAGCIGWPVRDMTQVRAKGLHPAQAIVLELMQLLREDAPAHLVEAVLKRDTALAFQLLKLVNTAAFGASTRVTSFQQALMLVGYRKMQQWLGMLLATAHRDPELAPMASYSIARGFLLENLGGEVQADLHNDLFTTGAFSLLDRLTGMPLEALFARAVLSPATLDALVSGTGPMAPFFELAVLSEQPDMQRVKRRLERLKISPVAYNRAVLRAAIAANAAAALNEASTSEPLTR
jgi:EAL and modified HD-GYP domain-containing signal transduction protein